MNKRKMVLLLVMCVIFVAIAVYAVCTHNSDKYYRSYEADNQAIVTEIIRCLDERDTDTLEQMFSKEVRSNNPVRSQIRSAFAVYNSKSVSCEEFFDQGIYESYAKYGRYLQKSVGADMKKVILENGKEFDIGFIRCVIDAKNPEAVGMRKIYLTDPEYGHLAIIGDVDYYTEERVRRNIDASNGITEEYINQTASIGITNGKTDKSKRLKNEDENVSYVEDLLHGMKMTPCEGSEEEYAQYEYKFTLMNRKNQVKTWYSLKDGKCRIRDDKNGITYYTVDDIDTYNELIELAKSLVG